MKSLIPGSQRSAWLKVLCSFDSTAAPSENLERRCVILSARAKGVVVAAITLQNCSSQTITSVGMGSPVKMLSVSSVKLTNLALRLSTKLKSKGFSIETRADSQS